MAGAADFGSEPATQYLCGSCSQMGDGFIDATDHTFYCNACWDKFEAEKNGGVGEMSRASYYPTLRN